MQAGTPFDFPPFPGFRDEALAFLRELKHHNERDWFNARKPVYEDEVRWPMRCLVADLARRASERDLPLTGDPKRSVFRIYRDVRFSKNKQPYKTHVSAALTRSGEKGDDGALYVHVEPGRSFVAVGFWHLERGLLGAWRRRMVEGPGVWLGVRDALAARGLALSNDDEALKRLPRGFTDYAESDVADYLRWKSFLVERPVDDAAVQHPDFTELVLDVAEGARPLLEFGWGLS